MDLRTDYEWNEDAPSRCVSTATVWKSKEVGRNIHEVVSGNPSIQSLLTADSLCPLRLERLACFSWQKAKASQAVHLQMEKIADGTPDGLSIFRISLQAWCVQESLHAHAIT